MKVIAYLFVIVTMTACGQGQKTAEELSGSALIEKKHDEVMVIHDEVMPKMGTIRKLKKGIQSTVDSLQTANSEPGNIVKLGDSVKELEAASDAMMVWMRAYSKPEEGTPDDEVTKYFDSEMEKVMEVRDKMLSAIEKAESLR